MWRVALFGDTISTVAHTSQEAVVIPCYVSQPSLHLPSQVSAATTRVRTSVLGVGSMTGATYGAWLPGISWG
jgi:hypothetical protein